MRIRIHRGAHEVGGNCVEIEADDGARIALDLGRPLSAAASDVGSMPTFAGPLLAAVISHPHLDHYGLVGGLVDVPVYLGREAAAILEAAAFFSPMTRPISATRPLLDREPVCIGQFTVTPYLVDHSAFDSYSLLVEIDGTRIFYTGDFRGHGRKSSVFERLLARPPRPIDVLITEGTHMRADSTGLDGCATEADLEHELTTIAKSTPATVALLASAQNIDRLVTAFRAARRSGRILVTDLYGATVATATRPSIPQPGFPGYRIYVPQRQRVLVKTSGQFERVSAIRDIRIFAEELAAAPERFLLYLPASATRELIRSGVLGPASGVFWSMWDGYLAESSGQRLRADLAAAGITLSSLHTSGHATVADLGRLIAALDPGQVVPIHTDAPQRFSELFDRATPHADGTWFAA